MDKLIADFLSSHLANFLWAASAFVIFVLGVYRFFIKDLLLKVDAREAKIAGDLREAAEAYAKAKGLQGELDAKMKAAEARIAAMMSEAAKDAEGIRATQVEKGRQEIEHMRLRSLQDIDAARNAALIELRNQIASLVVVVGEKAINERLDVTKHEALVDAALAGLATRKNS